MISKKEEILVKLLALLCILTPSQGFFIFYFIGSYVLLVVVSNNIIIDHACNVVFFLFNYSFFNSHDKTANQSVANWYCKHVFSFRVSVNFPHWLGIAVKKKFMVKL